MINKFSYIILLLGGVSFACLAQKQVEVPYTLEDRDRLIRIEAKFEQIDKRFEQVDRHFEQTDKRFEELRSDMNARFEQNFTYLWIISAIFTSLTVAIFGFAIWDRRTMVRPFETKVKSMEEEINLQKREGKNLVAALKELSKTDTKLAEILKQFNIL